MSLLEFVRPERICIVDSNGTIVRLNDQNRTELRFDASERLRARRMLNSMNKGHADCRVVNGRGPFRLLPLIEQGRV